MEVELKQSVPVQQSLAPIAEQEAVPLPSVDDVQQGPSSSSAVSFYQQQPNVHHQLKGPPRMVRLRRKRREDPFGTLVRSTKKMRLNEGGEAEERFAGEYEANAIVRSIGSVDGGKKNADGTQQQDMEGILFAEDGEDELLFYYGGQDEGVDSDAEGYDDDSDSNAEDYYKNEYPDEEQRKRFGFVDGVGNEFENESTSEDDEFDHYGDEQVKYRNYCYEEDNDGNEFIFGGGSAIASKKIKKVEQSDEEEDDEDY